MSDNCQMGLEDDLNYESAGYCSDDVHFSSEDEEKEASSEDDENYRMVDIKEVQEDMDNRIDEMQQVIQLPKWKCKLLLENYKWDTLQLLDAFYNGNIKEASKPTTVSSSASYEANSCNICLEPSEGELVSSTCAHQFCRSCWCIYLHSKVMGDGVGSIPCPQTNCDSRLEDEFVTCFLTEKADIERYKYLKLISYVSGNPALKFCPFPGCERIIKAQEAGCTKVKCACGHEFCFQCGRKWHSPLTCENMHRWLTKFDDKDKTETHNYLKSKTKNCPNCSSAIEKNGGCNHMSCTRCGKHFCWVCGQLWENNSHSYECNRYSEAAKQEAEKAEAALAKFQFYVERYVLHGDSLKQERKLVEAVEKKSQEMQATHQIPWIECQFLRHAVKVLNKCRETLMQSFAFAYFLESNNETELFSRNQSDLHTSVEQLSEYLERDLDLLLTYLSLSDIRQNVVDKSAYCEKRRQILVECIKEMQN